MRIADVLRNKGALVATITPETSVAGLLTELTVHNIGAMVVVSPDGLVGIVSERDVVRKLHELGADILRCPVWEIMTTLVATCTPTDSVDSLTALMTENGCARPGGQTAGWRDREHRRRGEARMEELKTQQDSCLAYRAVDAWCPLTSRCGTRRNQTCLHFLRRWAAPSTTTRS
jgi:CBS domain-containing protein